MYSLRARVRDKVAESLGGSNLGYSPTVATSIDNTAPSVAVSGVLWDRRDLAPLTYGDPVTLHVDASDAGAGSTHVELLVDGVPRGAVDQPCASGGCTLPFDFTLRPDDHADGRHTVTVRAVDGVGNQAPDVSWTVDVEAPPPQPPDDEHPEDAAPQSASASLQASVAADDPRAGLDHSLLPCTASDQAANFGVYSAGPTFEGMNVSMTFRRCDLPYPLEGVRANFVSYIYGTCDVAPEDETGCKPPIEIQSWPSCERSLGDYALDPTGAPLHDELLTLRGAPAAKFERRLEVYTGDSTVVVFGDDEAQIRRAVDALRQEPSNAPLQLPVNPIATAGGLLPPAVAGAIEGVAPCPA
jgi:hypothetical protein